MKKFFFRIQSAITAAKAAFLQPDIMVDSHFRVMASMYENILKVQERIQALQNGLKNFSMKIKNLNAGFASLYSYF